MSRAKSAGISARAFGSGSFSQHDGLSLRTSIECKQRQAIPVLCDERDVVAPNPPTHRDIAAECLAAAEAAVELTNRGRTFLALDTAAELGRMQRCQLWQSAGASEVAFRLWAETRCIPLEFVEAHGGGSLDVLRIASNTVDVAFFFDGKDRK